MAKAANKFHQRINQHCQYYQYKTHKPYLSEPNSKMTKHYVVCTILCVQNESSNYSAAVLWIIQEPPPSGFAVERNQKNQK